MEWGLGFAVIVGIYVGVVMYSRKRRLDALTAKYNDKAIARRIVAHEVWQGQTHDQLIDSIGKPEDIDQKVLKSKTKETWKYNRTGKNRFGLRVVVENNLVTGWEKKE